MIDGLRKVNSTRRPEDSVSLRLAVLVAVLIATAAVARQGAVSPLTALSLFIALPVAYWVSYVRRRADNWMLKIVIALGALIALARFFSQVGGVATIDEFRYPLADVFLWVQVLHGFDLPQRKDLNFSLGSSLALMGIAASLAQDASFGLFVVAYLVAAATSLALSHRSEQAEDALMMAPVRGRARASSFSLAGTGRGVVASATAGLLLFLVIPQSSGVRTFALPFQLGSSGGIGGGGSGITNPGFLSGPPGARSGGPLYYAFGAEMDLSVRGDLPDDLVLRVRASQPAMWRGLIFDTYDGRAWSAPTDREPELLGSSPPYQYPPLLRDLGPRTIVTQTFYVVAEQPNVIFSASQPDTVWFYDRVFVNELGSLTTDETITEDSAYSVVSSRPAAASEDLRRAPEDETPEALRRYLQLPDDVPARVGRLARDITSGGATRHDKVKAIEEYLAANYRYSTRSPVPESGRDAVDHFLFDTDVGFCEQFAAATAVMLRSLDIPARVVTGYTPGRRNPFSGLHEVRASDAHAWVEVWYPRFGWYEYDPTFDIPPAEESLGSSLPLTQVIEFVGDRLGRIAPGGIGEAARWVLLLAAVAILVWGGRLARRRLPRPSHSAPGPVPGAPVAAALLSLEQAMASLGVPRKPDETARELIARASASVGVGWGDAARTFERERYAKDAPTIEDVTAAVDELHTLTGAAIDAAGNGAKGLRRARPQARSRAKG